nr:hypothetical protein [Tanacetum cinerariifolium]
MLYHYKLGLSWVEARLVEFKNQEIKFCKKIRGLEFKVDSKTNIIECLTNELEMLKKEKEGLDSKLIASQSNSSQIKYEDINQIDEDGIEEMDTKWNMDLLSMRADRYWKKTRKKISFQGTNVAGFDKLKVECFNCHKIGHFARECRAPRSQDRGRRENFKQGSKVEESAPKALMVIDGVGWDWSYMANEEEDHALVADQEAPTEFALMAKSSSDTEDMSWTGLPEFVDDTITDYSRPSPNKESKLNDLQNNSSYVSENEESTSSILSKLEIKFVKAADSPTLIKTSKDETVRKPFVKYTEMYRKTSKSSNKFPTGNSKVSTADMGNKGKAVKASAC